MLIRKSAPGFLLLLWLLLSTPATPLPAEVSPLTLVADGKTDYVLFLPQNAPAAMERGASEIQSHLAKMTGATLPILRGNPQKAPQKSILILLSPVRHRGTPPLSDDGFRIEAGAGGRITVTAATPRGALYGCQALLEHWGVRWLTPAITHIPRMKSVLLMPDFRMESRPDFEYREAFFVEAQEKDWAARLRFNGFGAALDESTGGKIDYGTFVHTLGQFIPEALFDTHPEYFALRDGKRMKDSSLPPHGSQRCLTHPEVSRTTLAALRKMIRENPGKQIWSISQNDNRNFCQCPECEKIASQYGGQSGLMLWFVNRLATTLGREFPAVKFDTLAYTYTEKAPRGIKPAPNVIIRLCPIRNQQGYPYLLSQDARTRDFVNNLFEWGQLTPNLHIWHYNTCFTHYFAFFPDFRQFPQSIRLYKLNGVKGVFAQGSFQSPGGAWAELRSYVLSRLLWKSDQPEEPIVDEWMQGVYGNGWRPIKQLHTLIHDAMAYDHGNFTLYFDLDEPFVSPAVVKRGFELLARARKEAGNNPVAQAELDKVEISLEYLRINHERDAGPKLDAFVARVQKMGFIYPNERERIETWAAQFRERMKK